MTDGTLICIISLLGSKGAFVVVATTLRMHIRKWSWLQCWWERCWNETAVFLPPDLKRFLCVLIWLHCLVCSSLFCCWNKPQVFNLAPEVLTVIQFRSEQYSLCQTHRPLLALIDPNRRLWMVFLSVESHWSRCKKSNLKILFGFVDKPWAA